jgi:hypothetical protein
MKFGATEIIWAILVVAVIAAIAAATRVLRKLRKDVWRVFARDMSLRFDEVDGQPRVTGVLQGREFQLEVTSDGSDTGALGVEVIRMTLSLSAPPDGGLQLESADGLIGDAQRVLEADVLTTGDGMFDQKVTAHATVSRAALDWLTVDRRTAFRKLVQKTPDGVIRLNGRQLEWSCRNSVSQQQQLKQQLSLLLRAAHEIDPVSPDSDT